MKNNSILNFIKGSLQVQKLQNSIAKNENSVQIKGSVGSLNSFIISSVFKNTSKPILYVLENKETAAHFSNDLETLISKERVLFYPESFKKPYSNSKSDNSNILLRADVINKVNSSKTKFIIVTYYKALFEKIITKSDLKKSTLKINVLDELSIDFINETLFEYDFKRVDFVSEPGDFSVRGGIIDVFSFSNKEPYRIEFFGDEISRIRTFDLETQLSISSFESIKIIPNIQSDIKVENRINFFDNISNETLIVVNNSKSFLREINSLFKSAESIYSSISDSTIQLKPTELFSSKKEIKNSLISNSLIEIGSNSIFSDKTIIFKSKPQPAFNKSFDLLIENLNAYSELGYQNYLCCSNEQQKKRFNDIFENIGIDVNYTAIILPLHSGFIDNQNKIVC